MPNVIVKKYADEVGEVTSREGRELVTMISIICVIGNVLPPVFLFPILTYDAARMMQERCMIHLMSKRS